MKKIILLVVVYLTTFINAKSQSFLSYGDKTFGGNHIEQFVSIVKINENSLAICGLSSTFLNGDKTDPSCNYDSLYNAEVWLIKIDSYFNIIWNKSLGGQENEASSQMLLTNNNNIIVSTFSQSDSTCEKTEHNRSLPITLYDYWVCLVDTNGNVIWDKTLGGTTTDEVPFGMQLGTGDFIVVGRSGSPISGDKTVANHGGSASDYWAVKLDSLGNKIWDNVYGGTGVEPASSFPINNRGISILPCETGSFIIAGNVNSPISGDVSDSSFGGRDIWIIKIDSAGNKIWDKRYGGTTNNDETSQIIKTTDGFIIVATTASPQGGSISDPTIGGGTAADVWLIKLDSLGNKQWDKRYGGVGGDIGASIVLAPGGGYWVSASTNSPAGFDVTDTSYGGNDYWIFKIDSAGNKLWDKRFGGPGNDFASNFVIMPDTSIFLSGSAEVGTSAVKTDYGKGLTDYWLVHFKYDDYSTGINTVGGENNLVTVFPNPTNDILSVQGLGNKNASIEITNQMGQLLFKKRELVANDFKIDVKDFSQGVYFLEIQSEKARRVLKFVKM
jgi:Secretion system C-terminal sorting domain